MVELEFFSYVDRPIYFAALPSLADWPETRPAPLADFALLLLIDARSLGDADIHRFSRTFLSQGIKYLCVWGPESEKVHDIFDEELSAPPIGDVQGHSPDRQLITTTWHTEALDEAIFYFLNCAHPCGPPTDPSDSWVVAAVGNPQWAKQVRERLANPYGKWLDDYLRSK
jgi:hypothetical protein